MDTMESICFVGQFYYVVFRLALEEYGNLIALALLNLGIKTVV